MESKFNAEMDEHKMKLDKEYDSVKAGFAKELERLSLKHAQELEKRVSKFFKYTLQKLFNNNNEGIIKLRETHSNVSNIWNA